MKARLKNYGLWISVASLAFMVVQNSGLQITPEQWNSYVNAILTVLVLAGIINNPTTDNKGFGDD
jgi:phi LC3 family holin